MTNYSYAEGCSPDRCRFRNGYITESLIQAVKDSVIGSDEMSNEDVILIIDYLKLKEDDANVDKIVTKIDAKLTDVLNNIQNKGVGTNREGEEFLMRIVGWEEYCILLSEMSKGATVTLGIGSVGNRKSHGYFIKDTERF